ncbi:MAG: amidohydrolase family protein, partial [Actinobacteria bacterium]|nr:amidohydrolase family protein [Actinomycetota bacterium]
VRARRAPKAAPLGAGVALIGTVWPGGNAEPFPGLVLVDGRGVIDRIGPIASIQVPETVPVIGTREAWIGPGVIDAHVHLAFGDPDACLAAGLVGVRDLGAPSESAVKWRSGHRSPTGNRPMIAAAGPIITAPGGYPSRSWGAGGFAAFVTSASQARQVVQRIAANGADVIKLALEPGSADWPVPEPVVARAVVEAAHSCGLAVVAHALRSDMVARAVEAGVDELAHTPTERLTESMVARIAEAGVAVVSTLQTFFSAGVGREAAENAAAFVEAGVLMRYGTDLGNTGTRPGVDPRELDRLADAGLGRRGALRAATEFAAAAPGIRGRSGRLEVGQRAAAVVLPGDPLAEPGLWRAPVAVMADGRLVRPVPPPDSEVDLAAAVA